MSEHGLINNDHPILSHQKKKRPHQIESKGDISTIVVWRNKGAALFVPSF